jgi:hypothetical protein
MILALLILPLLLRRSPMTDLYSAEDATRSFRRFRLWQVPGLVLLAALLACGGGGSSGGGGGQPPPPPADFSLAVSPTASAVVAGSSTTISLSATAKNGFTAQVSVQVSGLPAGVTVSPTSISVAPGAPQQITLSAANAASNTNGTVTFTGTSGSLTHSAQLTLGVFTGLSRTPPVRTRYVRSDAVTPYFTWINSYWILYHSATKRFFVTDPFSGHVFVFDATSETQIASISVPGAYGIDDTPDHGTLYVGTYLGDIYTIDPVAMTVNRRYVASQIGPYGYFAFNAVVMADGKVAMLGAEQGIANVDGSSSIAVWNPADNSITIWGVVGRYTGLPLPCGALMGNIGGFARTADRTKILVGSIDSDNTLCQIDPNSGQSNYVTGFGGLYHLLTSPDGKYLILPEGNNAVLYDPQTLDLVAQFPVAGDGSSASGFAVSADSKTLFTPTDSIVYAYDLSTHQLVGWFPNIFLPATSGGFNVGPGYSANLQAVDGTGLLAGPMEEGIGFVDSAAMQTGPAGTLFTNAFLNPASGPTSGGTATQWSSQMPAGILQSVYFGGQTSVVASVASGFINTTTPPGLPGPADVYAFGTDGSMEIVPEGFSYGPTNLETTPNKSTAEGGGTGVILGYGLVPVSATTNPPHLQISVGGSPASIAGFTTNAYQVSPYPFALEAVLYTIPAGGVGNADVTVSNNSGTTTTTGALEYLPATKQFSLSGASLAQGIYDSHRDLYYFTDAAQIQEFSLTQQQWLTPISIPSPSGATQRLWGLALSPDGTKLAVADAQAGVIYLLNPANPGSVTTFPIPLVLGVGIVNPCGVAVSNAGMVYFAADVPSGSGFNIFFKLNTNSGVVTPYFDSWANIPTDIYSRVQLSNDSSRVYFNGDGFVFSIDTASDAIFPAFTDLGCCYGDYELTLSSNQTQLEASSYLYDADLNAASILMLNDREFLNTQYVYGAKLSADGRLLFQPSVHGIDVFDGRLGNLIDRIALPFALSTNYDALVSDGKDNILIAITGATGTGIAVVDLASIQEPPPLPYYHRATSRSNHGQWLKDVAAAKRRDTKTADSKPNMRLVPHLTKPLFRVQGSQQHVP